MEIGDSIQVTKDGAFEVLKLIRMGDTVYAQNCNFGTEGYIKTPDNVDLERHIDQLLGKWRPL